jgi:hypothetical protein
MRYPEFNVIHNMKETISLRVELKFNNPSEFKDALRLHAIQRGFEKKARKARVSTFCKKRCGWKIHASWMNDKKAFQIKTFFDTIIATVTTTTKGQLSSGLRRYTWTTFGTNPIRKQLH